MDQYKTPATLRQLAAVLLSVGAIGRPLIAPPQMPAERLAILREAYAKMIADPEFHSDAKRRDWEVEYTPGQELDAIAKRAVSQHPDIIALLRKTLRD